MPLGKIYRWVWRAAQVLRAAWVTVWWSACYNLFLRLHPAVALTGWIKVTGRMAWRVHPTARVVLGRGVRINSGSLLNAVGGQRPTIIAVLKGAELVIADDVGLSSVTIVSARKVSIGAGTLIGGGASVYDSDFHSANASERALRPDPGAKSAPIAIGAECFVGTGALLVKGVTVGARAVIGAGAVVTGAVPEGEIWAGNPARFVGQVPMPKGT